MTRLDGRTIERRWLRGVLALLLLASCGHTHHTPPHEHKIKWLISQGTERYGRAEYAIFYACCECGAEMEMNRSMMDSLLHDQGVTLTTEVPH